MSTYYDQMVRRSRPTLSHAPRGTYRKRGRKLRLDEIPAALAAHDRAQAASDAIRKPLGLEPVPETQSVIAWRQRLAQPARRKVSTNGDDPLEAIGKAQKARKRAESALVNRVKAAVDAGVPVARCAAELDMTRQGVYKMIARAV